MVAVVAATAEVMVVAAAAVAIVRTVAATIGATVYRPGPYHDPDKTYGCGCFCCFARFWYLRYLVVLYKKEIIRCVPRVHTIGTIPLNTVSYVSPYAYVLW